jgi:LPXTG-motif cell wall-anchored protein
MTAETVQIVAGILLVLCIGVIILRRKNKKKSAAEEEF